MPNLRTWGNLNAQGLPKLIIKKPHGDPDTHCHPVTALCDAVNPPPVHADASKSLARPQGYIDTPQIIYSEWPKAAARDGLPLGHLDASVRICLIGGGMANLVAGLELSRAGASVTLLEATGAVGGRCRSITAPDNINVAEMGAMRFPPSEDLLFHYAESMGFTFKEDFPDPGKVPTIVSFQGQAQIWLDSRTLAGFETVHDGWLAFVRGGITRRGPDGSVVVVLEGPEALQSILKHPDQAVRETVRGPWQAWLDTFGGLSFLEGLQLIFAEGTLGDIPGGKAWTQEDFVRFGSLGIGSGGFGPLFPVGFCTVFRLLPNGLETSQMSFARRGEDGEVHPVGITSLADAILKEAKSCGLQVKLNTTGIPLSATLSSVNISENGLVQTYDFAIIATTTSAMAASWATPAVDFIQPSVQRAISDIHIIKSSKLFVRTKKFWSGDVNFPRVVISDTPGPQLYTLDYDHPEYGMVLVTYTWEAQSAAMQQYTDPESLFAYLISLIAEVVAGLPDDTPDSYKNFVRDLVAVTRDDYNLIHWQLDPAAQGAFVLGKNGQHTLTQAMFYDFIKLSDPTNVSAPILLSGDSISFTGGWIDGGLQCALNAVSAVLAAKGTVNHPELAPITLLKPDLYDYTVKGTCGTKDPASVSTGCVELAA
jgi:tryptophan 2-monooxygenase